MSFNRGRLGFFMAFVWGCLCLLVYTAYSVLESNVEVDVELPVVEWATPPEPEVKRVEDVITPNSTMQDLLLKFGFTHQSIHAFIEDVRPVYDLNRIKAGKAFSVETRLDGRFQKFDYYFDEEEYLSVTYESGKYSASRHLHEFEDILEEFYGEIETSLWDTLTSRGEKPQLVALLSQIFQWDIDFTLIQPGDSFKLMVEKRYLNGEFVKYGTILSTQFNSGGRSFLAFLFKDPEKGTGRYYDEKGKAVRKAFLKIPFNFSPRISSGFSHSRFHPILKRRRPHLGVDYAAPTGTWVLSSASGKVVFAGRDGGYGNLLKIRHPNGYTTSYAHLSKFAVRVGEKVNQGQRIGKVGSTGLATGPHLDYRVQNRHGSFINPRNVSTLPSDKPVDKRYWNQFVSLRDDLWERLNTIPEGETPLPSIMRAD